MSYDDVSVARGSNFAMHVLATNMYILQYYMSQTSIDTYM